MSRRFLRLPAIAVAVTVVGAPCVHAQVPLETRLKAAVVSKFPQFVEWPPSVWTNRSSVDVCVLGSDRMTPVLQELVAGEAIDGRALVVREVDRDEDVDQCHVLFAGAGATGTHRTLLRRAASLPVLTVSDDPKFLDNGGIVRLREVDGRLRFEVNAAAPQRVGLRISSQLLQLALSVRSGPA